MRTFLAILLLAGMPAVTNAFNLTPQELLWGDKPDTYDDVWAKRPATETEKAAIPALWEEAKTPRRGEAAVKLGAAFEHGVVVPTDRVQALVWYHCAIRGARFEALSSAWYIHAIHRIRAIEGAIKVWLTDDAQEINEEDTWTHGSGRRMSWNEWLAKSRAYAAAHQQDTPVKVSIDDYYPTEAEAERADRNLRMLEGAIRNSR